MLEPRRLAARSVAARMASLLGEELGKQAGYRIRFEKMTSKETRIEVVTDGIFNRMLQQDNALEEAGLILFDEFHERSLQVDFALALTLQCQQILRPDLRIGIMSATLETETIQRALDSCPVLTCDGKQFPVEIVYEAPRREDSIVTSVFRLLKKIKNQEGGILVFLPGAGEILKVYELIKNEGWTKNVFPLYGDLPFRQQQEALSGKGIILATSIAETSLTIEGITAVVDCGYARTSKFNPNTGLSGLETVRVTCDAA
ncbi:MAG: ATP-dependent helicase, partial [Candidatus Nephrothrix sp. EaCA]